MELSTKIAGIKEKIAQLASKVENLRSENLMMTEENKELRTKLQRSVEEVNFLKHQLAVLKEQNVIQSPNEVVEREE